MGFGARLCRLVRNRTACLTLDPSIVWLFCRFFQVVWELRELSCTDSVPSIRGKPGSPSCWWEDASLLRALLSSPLSSVWRSQRWNPNSEGGAVPASASGPSPAPHRSEPWTLKHLTTFIRHPVMVNSIYCFLSAVVCNNKKLLSPKPPERMMFIVHLVGGKMWCLNCCYRVTSLKWPMTPDSVFF